MYRQPGSAEQLGCGLENVRVNGTVCVVYSHAATDIPETMRKIKTTTNDLWMMIIMSLNLPRCPPHKQSPYITTLRVSAFVRSSCPPKLTPRGRFFSNQFDHIISRLWETHDLRLLSVRCHQQG
jgi:hypothetical protein